MAISGLKKLRGICMFAYAAKIVSVGPCPSVPMRALLIEMACEKILENGTNDDPKE